MPNKNVERLAVKIYCVLHGSIQINKVAELGKLLTAPKSLVKDGQAKREILQQLCHQLAMDLERRILTTAPG